MVIQNILQIYSADSGQPALALACLEQLGIDLETALQLRTESVDTAKRVIYGDGGAVLAEIPPEINEVLHMYRDTAVAQRSDGEVCADDLGFFVKRFVAKGSNKVGKPISVKQAKAWMLELCNQYAERFGEK